MAKARSPQYPAIGLKDAIEKVTAVYNRDYQNPIPRAVAAGHMGYQSLNGKSLGVLSAVLKYGLLEGRGDDTRVSDLAVAIIAHPPGESARVEALKEAASKPELFSELDARFQGGKASDQALRSYLLTQKFIPSAADAVIRSYRETKSFVDVEMVGYDAPSKPEVGIMTDSSRGEISGSSVAGAIPPNVLAEEFPDLNQAQKNNWKVLQDGKRLRISASVDLKGLKLLLKNLEGYKAVLDFGDEDSEGEDA
jgi:hypothetical protein